MSYGTFFKVILNIFFLLQLAWCELDSITLSCLLTASEMKVEPLEWMCDRVTENKTK